GQIARRWCSYFEGMSCRLRGKFGLSLLWQPFSGKKSGAPECATSGTVFYGHSRIISAVPLELAIIFS
ncbi:MAG: hypothetical protein WA627_06850, partial [Candidatus Sulfotelmatobacter sp.]